MNEAILQYVEPIYRFCLKRLASGADAEDLSQDILLSVLQGIQQKDVANMDGYVWRIARNRYARMIQARKGEPVVLHGHDTFPQIAATEPEDDGADARQGIFVALHTLSNMYREIMVDFYVHRHDVRRIAARQGISVEAVKWRLHVGRARVKERMTHMEKHYDRVSMHVMCNGHFNPTQYLNTQIHKAIAKVCYPSPLSLEDVSLATGVPTLYLEETLAHMVAGDAITQTGGKYATNFIITPATMGVDFLKTDVVAEITRAIWAYVQATEGQLRDIGFYGKDFPLAQLLHIIVPAIIRGKGGDTQTQDFPQRQDGGFGWFIVHEGLETLDWRFTGLNSYLSGKNATPRFLYFWVGDTLNHSLGRLLNGNTQFFLSALGKDFSLMIPDQANEAQAIAHGLCKDVDGRIMPTIPIFSEAMYSRFMDWAKECDGFQPLWEQWVNVLTTGYKSTTPKRLHDQIPGNVDGKSFDLSAYVIKTLQNQGLASVPEADTVFADNLLLVR